MIKDKDVVVAEILDSLGIVANRDRIGANLESGESHTNLHERPPSSSGRLAGVNAGKPPG
jgi:hypothetical protein